MQIFDDSSVSYNLNMNPVFIIFVLCIAEAAQCNSINLHIPHSYQLYPLVCRLTIRILGFLSPVPAIIATLPNVKPLRFHSNDLPHFAFMYSDTRVLPAHISPASMRRCSRRRSDAGRGASPRAHRCVTYNAPASLSTCFPLARMSNKVGHVLCVRGWCVAGKHLVATVSY